MNNGVFIIFYDLPMDSRQYRREYYLFRKELLNNGYVALQKSVYVKTIRNFGNMGQEILKCKKIAPKHGNVHFLPLHMNDFSAIKTIAGDESVISDIISNVMVI